jgi:hypothetical protein
LQWKRRGELFTEKKHRGLNYGKSEDTETTSMNILHKEFTKSEMIIEQIPFSVSSPYRVLASQTLL